MVSRALTIATSDSGGGAGIQADLKAFAAAGVHGSSVLVALTAQNTREVTAIHELPPQFIVDQLDAVFDDIGVDAAKTGMLFSRTIIETVAAYLRDHPVRLVVDPVMVASSGTSLLEDDAVDALVGRLFPLATVVTPNQDEATALVGPGGPDEQAVRLVELGARAAIVTGSGQGDWLYDGELTLIGAGRVEGPTHGSGCTHSAMLTAGLARGIQLVESASEAAAAAGEAIANGLDDIGSGEGPVDVLNIREISRYE